FVQLCKAKMCLIHPFPSQLPPSSGTCHCRTIPNRSRSTSGRDEDGISSFCFVSPFVTTRVFPDRVIRPSSVGRVTMDFPVKGESGEVWLKRHWGANSRNSLGVVEKRRRVAQDP